MRTYRKIGVVLVLVGFFLALLWFGWKFLAVLVLLWVGRNLITMANWP